MKRRRYYVVTCTWCSEPAALPVWWRSTACRRNGRLWACTGVQDTPLTQACSRHCPEALTSALCDTLHHQCHCDTLHQQCHSVTRYIISVRQWTRQNGWCRLNTVSCVTSHKWYGMRERSRQKCHSQKRSIWRNRKIESLRESLYEDKGEGCSTHGELKARTLLSCGFWLIASFTSSLKHIIIKKEVLVKK